MAISRFWAGKVFGTNVGNVFVELTGGDHSLSGILRFNDSIVGVIVFEVSGEFSGGNLKLSGEIRDKASTNAQGTLTVAVTLVPDGNLKGRWESTSGAGGTLVLFPHGDDEPTEKKDVPADQMYTAKHQFGPVQLERGDIVQLAENVQRGFQNTRVVISLV